MPAPDFDWSRLEDDVDAYGRFSPPTTSGQSQFSQNQRFPCEHCSGTGKWSRGRNSNGVDRCFACGGKGYFLTSAADRAKARTAKAARAARQVEETRVAYAEAHPAEVSFLRSCLKWRDPSDFICSLNAALDRYGYLTERQLGAVRSMMLKVEATRTQRAAQRDVVVDLTPIKAMFDKAASAPLSRGATGRKPPRYLAAGLAISRAPDHGRNPGALYVKRLSDEEYLGKIIGTTFQGKPEAMPALLAIAKDPRGEAVKFGKEFTRCSCCGRDLTDPESIEAGIGPVCATKWGL